MNNISEVTLGFAGGTEIRDAIRTAIALAQSLSSYAKVDFQFNGVTLRVSHDSDPAIILARWDAAIRNNALAYKDKQ